MDARVLSRRASQARWVKTCAREKEAHWRKDTAEECGGGPVEGGEHSYVGAASLWGAASEAWVVLTA